MARTVEYGTAAASPGEIATGRLTAGDLRDGSEFDLPVAVANGADDGETFYLQAVSDGDELNGLGVVREVMRRLDPAELAGELLVTGVLNYHGFHVNEHENPVDGTKLNRVFPGSSAGNASERLAKLVYDNAVRRADAGLDLHQGSTSRMIHEVRVRCGRDHRLHDDCLELARQFGFEHLLDLRGPDGQLARAAPDDGIPIVDPELGGSTGWDRTSVEQGVAGVFNVLRARGMLPGDPDDPGPQRVARDYETVNADRGGLLDPHVDLYDRVDEGDPLCDVTTVFGEHRDTITASEGGVVWRLRRLPMVATGEYVMSIGTDLERLG